MTDIGRAAVRLARSVAPRWVLGSVAPQTAATANFDNADSLLATARAEGLPGFSRQHVGHGIGLEVNEQPIINPKTPQALEAGMVLDVESQITSVAFSADGQCLYIGHANTTCSQIQLPGPFGRK